MNRRPERPSTAVSVPMSSGAGMSPSVGVAAPIGAVSRKDRERAGRTALRQDGASRLLLVTALPGRMSLQRRSVDGGRWETIDTRRVSRLGRTRIDLPREAAAPPQSFRVVFSPRNPNITSWTSGDISG